MVLGYYVLLSNGSVLWKDFEDLKGVPPDILFNSVAIKKYWMVPENLPGNSIRAGKRWCINLIAEMILAGANKRDVQEIAERNLSIPSKIFNIVYREVCINGDKNG